ncbi:MAG: fatty acid [Planctomycetota bacterium]|nr:MAG: fatty acid [Planctomycetota bacterium]
MEITTGKGSEARDPYAPFRARLLSPARVKQLSELRPAHVVADTFLCWLAIAAAWTAVALHPAWWMVLVAVPIIGSRYYALFIIGHDGMHRRLFENRRFNDFFNDAFILAPVAAITRINNRNHLLHHQHLANPWDPDRYRHACFNKSSRGALLAFVTGLASIWPLVRNVFVGRPAAAPALPAPDEADAARRGYSLRDLLLLAAWQGGLIGGLTWFIGWWAYPALWMAPVYLFAFLGDNLRSFAEHSHPEADAKADEHRLLTYTSNLPERMLFAPMNMNFHAAHHLWVSIPYYNLPVADREMRASPGSQGLEWRGSYLAYLLRYSLALPIPGCSPAARA